MKTSNLLVVTMLAATVAGCTSPAPRTKFYTLAPAESAQPILETNVTIGVGPIRLPDMLDRPQIVVRTDSNKLQLIETAHWGGRLSDNLARVLEENLEQLLPNARIIGYPWEVRRRPDYQIVVNILEFDGNPKKETILRASWSIVIPKTSEELAYAKHAYRTETQPRTLAGMVSTLSKQLAELAQDIALSYRDALYQTSADKPTKAP